MAWNGRAPIRICDSAIEAKGRQTPANQAVKTCLISQILGNSTNPRDWDATNQNVNLQMFVYRPRMVEFISRCGRQLFQRQLERLLVLAWKDGSDQKHRIWRSWIELNCEFCFRNLVEILVKSWWNLGEILVKSCRNLGEIVGKSSPISPRFLQDFPKMSTRFLQDFYKIS